VRKAAILIAFAAALVLFLLCAPALPNGDGVGYVRAARWGQLAPGHPAFVPLLRLLGEPLVARAQWLSALCGALGIALVAWRVSGWAAAALAVSWGYLISAADIEVYAVAALLLIAVLVVQNRWLKVALAGVAIWFHLEHVMILPFVLMECGVVGAAIAASLGASMYAICAFGVMKLHGLGEAAHWILSSSHGFRDPAWKAPGAAVYGAARTLAYAPYPYEAPISMVVAQALVGGAAVAMVLFAARREPAPLGLSRRAVWSLVIPYGAFGVLFFPSDPERWLFLLPLFWMWAAPALARTRGLATLGLAILLLFNVALGVRPLVDSTPKTRVREARAVIREGDLVIGPGQGWDEYLDLFAPMPKDAELFLVSYHAGKDGPDAALAHIRRAAPLAHRVVLVRFYEDADPQGWKELTILGISNQRIKEAAGAGQVERLAPDVYAITRSPSRFTRTLP
jgi:hypothetical protein